MHADEVDTNPLLVRHLLAEQFPQWAELPIVPVPSAGTDNALYRLGHELVVRLPRIHWAVGQANKERYWLPRLAPSLPVAVPTVLARGEPGEGYPYPWAVYRWLDGHSALHEHPADLRQAAADVACFLLTLQRADTTGAPSADAENLRGAPLARRDAATREAIASLDGLIDAGAALAVWDDALSAGAWHRPPIWFHGDLLPGNLLFRDGRLSAVIDWSGAGVGDPACDLMIAWSLFEGESRDVFRAALGVDDDTWARGRGLALSQAVIFIPYYIHTNPVGVAAAQHALDAVLDDFRRGG
jgi:aminoglycoside phosphotransferase (APT) family kinase protein